MKTVDFRKLGGYLTDAINNAVENIDFYSFGQLVMDFPVALVDAIVGAIEKADFKSIAAAIGNFFKGAFDRASEWLSSVDWGKMGSHVYKSLKDVLLGLDFSGIAKSLYRMLGSALGAAVKFLASFCADAWADIKAYFSGKIEECGGNIPAGLWKGIQDGLGNIGKWIKENIVDPFVEGFKECFGIHSPSTVMEELGNYVVEGFFKGVGTFRNFLNTVSEWAGAVVEWFRKGEDGKGIVEHFKEFGSNVVTGFKDKVGTTYQTVKTNVTTWASGVKDWFTNGSYGGVNRTTFSNYANEVISGFREKVGATYQTVKSNITTWASNVRDWFTNSSYGGVNSTNFATYANNIITGFKDKVGSTYSTVKSCMTTFASKVKSWFTDTVSYNSFYQVAADVVSGFKNGIGNLYQTCKNTNRL